MNPPSSSCSSHLDRATIFERIQREIWKGERIRNYPPLSNLVMVVYKVAFVLWWLKSLLIRFAVAFHRVSWHKSCALLIYDMCDLHCSFVNAEDSGKAKFQIKRDLEGEKQF